MVHVPMSGQSNTGDQLNGVISAETYFPSNICALEFGEIFSKNIGLQL